MYTFCLHIESFYEVKTLAISSLHVLLKNVYVQGFEPHPPRAPFAAANASISSLERFLLLLLCNDTLDAPVEKSVDEAIVFRELSRMLCIYGGDDFPEKSGRFNALVRISEEVFDGVIAVDHVVMSELLRIQRLPYQMSQINRDIFTYSMKVSLN